jgi:hypothetical protein
MLSVSILGIQKVRTIFTVLTSSVPAWLSVQVTDHFKELWLEKRDK